MDNKTFLEKVVASAGLDKGICAGMIHSLSEILEDSVSEGNVVSIPSFGNFEPRKRNERIMSHPSSPGKRLLVPPKLVISFKPSSILKNKINNIEGK